MVRLFVVVFFFAPSEPAKQQSRVADPISIVVLLLLLSLFFFVFPILLAVAVVASTIQIRSLRLLVFSIVAGVEVVAIFSDRV